MGEINEKAKGLKDNEVGQSAIDPVVMRGWWLKYKIINGKAKKIYIGPMTETEMLDYDDTYRHNFASKRPKNA